MTSMQNNSSHPLYPLPFSYPASAGSIQEQRRVQLALHGQQHEFQLQQKQRDLKLQEAFQDMSTQYNRQAVNIVKHIKYLCENSEGQIKNAFCEITQQQKDVTQHQQENLGSLTASQYKFNNNLKKELTNLSAKSDKQMAAMTALERRLSALDEVKDKQDHMISSSNQGFAIQSAKFDGLVAAITALERRLSVLDEVKDMQGCMFNSLKQELIIQSAKFDGLVAVMTALEQRMIVSDEKSQDRMISMGEKTLTALQNSQEAQSSKDRSLDISYNLILDMINAMRRSIDPLVGPKNMKIRGTAMSRPLPSTHSHKLRSTRFNKA